LRLVLFLRISLGSARKSLDVKIGISGIGYQCAEHLSAVLGPWLDLRSKSKHEIYISLAYGVFPEVYSLSQLNPDRPDGSLASLREFLSQKKIDALFVSPVPKYEWDLRTCTLPFLQQRQIDLLWLLDLQDEIYSVDEIHRIAGFIENHPEAVWFKVNFKNYAFASDCYIEEFIAPRIWRARIPAAIQCFHYDNSVTYEHGQKQEGLPNLAIPRSVAFPKHLSWVGSPEYLKRKIKFQYLHYGTCSYRWDEESDSLQFNEDYYRRAGKQVPTVYKEELKQVSTIHVETEAGS
jgi:hypothetical protein